MKSKNGTGDRARATSPPPGTRVDLVDGTQCGYLSSIFDHVRGRLVSRGEDVFAVLSMPMLNHHTAALLTAGERDIACHILMGCTNQQIATMRGSCATTVRNQVHTIFEKLGVDSRTQLAAKLVPRPVAIDLVDKNGYKD
ncbi:MAG: LuxR C-terminal-related transcriptional regulator [Proteobacteria bacterium]|nr:LuxR C-terminal-related transcriptional regulator [Pseudomonadota bacterium]